VESLALVTRCLGRDAAEQLIDDLLPVLRIELDGACTQPPSPPSGRHEWGQLRRPHELRLHAPA
jgi:hypothetical protein